MNNLSIASDRAPTTSPLVPVLAARPASERRSPAEVLELSTHLVSCREELLAIALLDPAARAVLEGMAAELDRRVLRVGAVIELQGGSPCEARERFEALRRALAERPGAPEPLDVALEHNRALLRSTRLGWEGGDHLLQHTWVRRAHFQGATGAALPPSWPERVRALEREVARSVRQLVAGHQGLVGAVARRYRGLGLSREDLAQEGNIGLLRAIEKFDPERGASFSTYAVWWVRQAIRSALASQARTVRLPASALSTRYTLGRAASRLSHELGREPDARELSLATGVAPECVAELTRWSTEPLSLDAPRGEDQSHTIGDRVSDPDAPSPYDQTIARDSAARLQVLLAALSPREQLVIQRRFGLRGADEQTLEEIGRSLALTRERVRQIVNRALTRLEQRSRQVHLER